MPFYLCHPDDRDAIIANGIVAREDGYVDIFTDNMVANTIAKDQLFLDRYTLFWITPAGITSPLELNDIGEMTTKYQFRVKQSRVDERFVRLMGEHDVIKDRPTAWDYLFWSRRGFKKTDVEEQFQIIAAMQAGKISLDQANEQLAALSARINGSRVHRRPPKSAPMEGQSASPMLSVIKRASNRLEKALSAVMNLRDLRRKPGKAPKMKRKSGHNPYTDLSK